MYGWCSKFNICMQISEFSAGCSLLIIALPVQLLLKTQMLRSFFRILASNYPLQIKLIEEVTKLYKIIIFQLNFAGLLEPSFKCSIKYACELCCFTTWNKWNKVKLGWLAYHTTFWGDVNRNDCDSPDLFPFNEQWMFILTATYEKGPDVGKFAYDCSIYNAILTTAFPWSEIFIIPANPWWRAGPGVALRYVGFPWSHDSELLQGVYIPEIQHGTWKW